MRRTARTLPLLALLALAAAAAPAAAQERVTEHTIYLHEFTGGLHVQPERIHARVGDTLNVTVVNSGATPHNLVFCGDGTTHVERCEKRWAFTGMIPASQSASVTLRVEEEGTFDYYCDIPGHKSGGMGGQLIVQGDAAKKTVPAPGLALVAAALAGALLLARRR